MKIAWLCNSAIGTSETFLGDNLELLQKLGTVKAFCGNPIASGLQPRPDVQHLSFDCVPQKLHHVVRHKLTGKNVRTLSKRKRCLKSLLETLQEFEPDVVWVEFGTTAHVAAELLAALNVPFVMAVHGFDITREFKDPWYKSEFVRLANQSAAVVCASFHTQNLCRVSGVLPEKTQVIRLSLDAQRWLRNTPIQSDQPVRFVHLGRLVEKKGPLQTLMAFHQVLQQQSNAELTFIGEGPLKATIDAYIQQHRLEQQVHLLGAMPQDKALEEVQRHHVFCQHSVTGMDGDQEGFALSPAEAALLEMPIVATWHNGIPEHVIHEKTGILVREWDIEGMAAAMLSLAQNPELRQSMGQSGRQNIAQMCAPAIRLEILRELLNSATSS